MTGYVEVKAAIANEVQKALKNLGAELDILLAARDYSPAELYQVLSKHGANSDLLGIVGNWRDPMDDQWALNELRRWNTRAH